MSEAEYIMNTTLGEMSTIPTGHNHICVRGHAIVRGKMLHVTSHFYLHSNGEWKLGEEGDNVPLYHALYATGATQAFKERVRESLTLRLSVWVKEHPDALAEAARDYKALCVQARVEKIKELQLQIDSLKNEITRISDGEIMSRTPQLV